MATYRPIQISFWQDKFILSLTPEQKYFYLYLLTNSKTKQCGIYELPKNVVCLETGYNLETVNKLIAIFVDLGKILYDKETEEIYIKNWVKFNQIDNKNIFICVIKELNLIKSKYFLKEYAKHIQFMNLKQEFAKKIKGACKGLVRGCLATTKEETESETKVKSKTELHRQDFELFWNIYDKKIGEKDKIYMKFCNLTDEDRKIIKESLPTYIKSTPDKKFRKNPQTYLRQRSWLDEIIISDGIFSDNLDLEPKKY